MSQSREKHHSETRGLEQSPPTRIRWAIYSVIISVAMILTTARLFSSPPLQSANDRSRWCTVWSLVERGTYQIDEIRKVRGWDSIDIVRHEDHFYSTKPPLFPTMVAGIYWCGKHALRWNMLRETDKTTDLILILVNIFPMAIALVLLASMCERYSKVFLARVMLVATASFATLLTPFLTALNNHTVAATSLIIALWSLLRIVSDGKSSLFHFAICGIFAAFTCCNELPAAFLGVLIFLMLFRNNPSRTMAAFVPAALVPLIGFFVTTYLATGGWKPFYMYYGTEKYVYTFEGIPSYWSRPKALDRGVDSPPVYFLHCMIGHHGIFSLTPVYLLMFGTWLSYSRWKASALRPAILLGAIMTAVVITFYMTRTENYNYGGNSVALRWVIWLTPFWLLTLLPMFDHLCQSTRKFTIVLLLVGVSVFSAWFPYSSPWKSPWIYSTMSRAGWLPQYRGVRVIFDVPHYTWFDKLSTANERDKNYWVELGCRNMSGGLTVLRMADGGPMTLNDEDLRRIDVSWSQNGAVVDNFSIHVSVSDFDQGKPPIDYLRWPTIEPDEQTIAQRLEFLQGLPKSKRFYARSTQYIKTNVRKNAFGCRRGYAYINVRGEPGGQLYQHRSDLWLSEEVPFGTVRWLMNVSKRPNGEIQNRRAFEVIAVGKFIEPSESDTASTD